MLVNYIKVFQQADLEVVVAQAERSNNVTGAGGAVPGDSSRSTSDAVRRSRGWRGVELMAESKEGVRGWRLIMRSDGSGRADPADVFMVGVGV